MRVIEKIEVSKLKYGCVVVTQNFLFNYSLFKIILNPSKKVEFSSENQKDMSVDGKLDFVQLTKFLDKIHHRLCDCTSEITSISFDCFRLTDQMKD